MRLDKYLSERLGIPRGESRKLAAKGRVTVNGVLTKKADTQIEEATAEVAVDGRPLAGAYQKYVYLMLNKPEGVVSAAQDKRDTTVVDLVKDAFPRRQLFPAGRLDKTSTGFVLLTDDGTLAHDILAPGRHVPKQYLVTLDTPLTNAMRVGFAAGVTLADGQTLAPAEVKPAGADPCVVRVTLHQGVYHQIKRMFGVFDAGVNALHREVIGPVALDAALVPGQWRELTAEEVNALRAAATPRGVWKQLPLTALPLQNAGNDIARHLRGCDAMVLMAVTLGSGADTLMRRLELTDIALAAVVDAMASAVMEELCNALEAEIRTSVQAQGHYLTGRFSPGYGDCPLTLQQPFAIALDTVRGLGMAVTPENLLTPRKSVTAILGVADHPVTGARAGCGHCLLREKCEYRKRGTTCEN